MDKKEDILKELRIIRDAKTEISEAVDRIKLYLGPQEEKPAGPGPGKEEEKEEKEEEEEEEEEE